MKALFLIQGHEVPSSRYRVLQFLPFWEQSGHEAIVLEHDEALKNKSQTLILASQCQIVFIHRKRLSHGFVMKLKNTGAKMLYDVDDAVMYHDALHKKSNSWLRRFRYNRLVKAMDTVIVGNSYIANNTKVKSNVLPTCLPMSGYEIAKDIKESEVPTLVWIGDSGSLHYLKNLIPVLEKVGQQVKNCRLKIICDHFFDLQHMQVIKVPWSKEKEVAELADSQVGLMPLGDDAWSKGKCALKFLQYLAVARPAVVTPVGMNQDLLAQGECGLKAETEEEWEKAILHLLSDATDRQNKGKSGRRLVLEQFSLEARAKDWVKLLEN